MRRVVRPFEPEAFERFAVVGPSVLDWRVLLIIGPVSRRYIPIIDGTGILIRALTFFKAHFFPVDLASMSTVAPLEAPKPAPRIAVGLARISVAACAFHGSFASCVFAIGAAALGLPGAMMPSLAAPPVHVHIHRAVIVPDINVFRLVVASPAEIGARRTRIIPTAAIPDFLDG